MRILWGASVIVNSFMAGFALSVLMPNSEYSPRWWDALIPLSFAVSSLAINNVEQQQGKEE